MTQTLGTTSDTNDIFIGANGNLTIWQGQAAVEGACATASRAALKEMILAQTSGLPFFQAVFVGVPNLPLFDNYLRQTLEGISGVIAVKNLVTSFGLNSQDKSVFKYTATIENEYGDDFEIEQEIPSP